ncbi:PucR family transcriptional regulator [Nocardiopsis aegyptia]|uniref:Sugar diacid utilization regulator n=1 Tax=Nocardiopsis aegyptia TaxID=220378 RepID=A0A7Z0J7M1_9ACTN|nr:PucR family transcriptional regulator [Nocardiopsis aegyptia]NYJ32163.1 sugar diacid utilization regulator [Nocardiopsis aegyptia]
MTPQDMPGSPVTAHGHLALLREGPSPTWDTRTEETLRALAGGRALTALSSHGGRVVLPCRDERRAVRTASKVRAALRDRPVWIGVAWSAGGEGPRALHEAREVVRLARGLRFAPGVYRLCDVMMEYACARTPRVRAAMLARIAPVAADPVLRPTLEAVIDAGGNRSRAARELFIHRSTIDYRLGRVHERTGHDPADSRGLQYLRTALALLHRAPAEASALDAAEDVRAEPHGAGHRASRG